MKNEFTPLINVTLYSSFFISLIYLIDTSHRIIFEVSIVVWFMQSSHESHWKEVKLIIQYVCSTKMFGLWYKHANSKTLEAYINVDWDIILNDRKITSRYFFFLSESHVSWSNKKQHTTSLFVSEVEYMISSLPSTQAIWMVILFEYLGMDLGLSIWIYGNNTNTINMTKNSMFLIQRKHITILHHFIRDLVKDGLIKFKLYHYKDKLMNIVTKELWKDNFLSI